MSLPVAVGVLSADMNLALLKEFRTNLKDLKCDVIVAYDYTHFWVHAKSLVEEVLGLPKRYDLGHNRWEYADDRSVWFIHTGANEDRLRGTRLPVLRVTGALLDQWKGVER